MFIKYKYYMWQLNASDLYELVYILVNSFTSNMAIILNRMRAMSSFTVINTKILVIQRIFRS